MARARKRFGQHFLVDGAIIEEIVAAIDPQPDDILVEIGPGRAALTEPLAACGAALHAVEFDRDLVAGLRTQFASRDHVHIHEADALSFDFAAVGASLRIVGNLPYNISTPLLFRLLAFRESIVDLHFMLQKEVVDRMAAVPGNKDYGRLTVMLGCRMEVVPLFEVPPEAFAPAPRVVSTVVRMRPLPDGHFDIRNQDGLERLVKLAFSRRRKTLRNALAGMADSGLITECGLDPATRPEQIPIAGWVELANRLDDAPDTGTLAN